MTQPVSPMTFPPAGPAPTIIPVLQVSDPAADAGCHPAGDPGHPAARDNFDATAGGVFDDAHHGRWEAGAVALDPRGRPAARWGRTRPDVGRGETPGPAIRGAGHGRGRAAGGFAAEADPKPERHATHPGTFPGARSDAGAASLPYVTGKINGTFLCLRARGITGWEEEYVGFGMPFSKLKDLVVRMEKSRRGFPYSIFP